MKKFLFFIIICFCLIDANAKERVEVQLDKCVDGDTAWFIYQNKSSKFRFLAINTPESTNKIEPYGKDASKFTCNLLSQANIIEVEFDPNSNKKDKYDRYLAWIFVDGELIQEKLLEKGYAEIKYIYGDYLYLDRLKKIENSAKQKELGIFHKKDSNFEANNNILLGIGIFLLVIFFLLNSKFRKKVFSRLKRQIRKEYKNYTKKIH